MIDSISRKLTLGDPDVVTGPIPDKSVGLHGPYHLPNPPGHDYVPTIKDKYIFSKNNNCTLQRPANYTGHVLAQSSTLPAANIVRSFAFGMKQTDPLCQSGISSTGLMSGPAMFCLSNRRLLYAAAALGVVHDLNDQSQIFFDKHSHEVTCITVDPSQRYVASGEFGDIYDKNLNHYNICLGLDAKICIWQSHDGDLVRQIGKGFFRSAVCALCFSYDARYIGGVGCDEKHTMGIWNAMTGVLITRTTLGNDIPPQIKLVAWCPEPQCTSYINRDHEDLNDLFVTGGHKNLKFWSFKRPASSDGDASEKEYLSMKQATFGKCQKGVLRGKVSKL